MFEPAIKWSGSKRSQAESIVSFFPDRIATYHEPFCGGASVLRALAESGACVGRFVCSDVNRGLIDLWNAIKERPADVCGRYSELWEGMRSLAGVAEKRAYYNRVRERYNRDGDPLDFMFIMRTAANGMPRYNGEGRFNTPYHLTRDGISPDRLSSVVSEWSELLNSRDVVFECRDYSGTVPAKGDFVYLDPPYHSTKGMYYGAIDFVRLWEWMEGLGCGYALSFDGVSGCDDNTYDVPKKLYDRHVYLQSGNSSFNRLFAGKGGNNVYESLYLKGCPDNGLF